MSQEASTIEVIYKPEMILARVAVIEKVLESWKGVPGYAETIRMEIWALRLAAATLNRARKAVDQATFENNYDLTEDQRWGAALDACRALDEG
jgi:hypothetical protein